MCADTLKVSIVLYQLFVLDIDTKTGCTVGYIYNVVCAAKALQDHLDYRKKLFRQYAPAEAKRLDLGQVFTKSPYAVLIITEKGDAVRDAFEAFVD